MRPLGLILSLCLGAAGAAHAASLLPPAFVGVQATGVSGELAVTWTAVANVTGYVVNWSDATDNVIHSQSVAPTLNALTLTTLANSLVDGETYTLSVASADAVSVTTQATWADPVLQWPYQAASAPLSFTATLLNYGQGVFLGFSQPSPWDGSGDFGAIQVLASGSGQAYTAVMVVDGNEGGVTLSASALPCGSGYNLAAQALDSWGDPGKMGAFIRLTPPCAVKLSTGSLSGTGVVGVSWTAGAGAGSYQVYQSTYSQPPLSAGLTLAASALGTAKGLATSVETSGVPLFLRAAWTTSTAQPVTPVASPLSNEIEVLPPPQGLVATGYTGATLLQWQSNLQTNMPVTSYAVFHKSGTNAVFDASVDTADAFVAAPPLATMTASVVITGLTQTAGYSFAVASVTGAGTKRWAGPASAPVTASANMAYPTISEAQSLTQSSGPNLFQVNWLASQDYAGSSQTWTAAALPFYQLWAVTSTPTASDGTGILSLVTATASTFGQDPNRPTTPTQVWYYVTVSLTAKSNGVVVGNSLTFTPGLAGLVSLPVLDTPVMLPAVVEDNGRVQLAWSTVPNADHYQVLRATGLAGPYVALPTGLLSSLTMSGQTMGWVDATAVNNAVNGNAYEVEALKSPPPGVAGSALPSAASSAVVASPGVGPGLPGPWYRNALNGPDFQTSSGNAITAVASVLTPNAVDLVWTPAGAGSSWISFYNVQRGYSATGNAWTSLTYTVFANVPATNDLVRAQDTSANPPLDSLWYRVQSVDAQGNTSAWVTSQVGTALAWGPPTLSVLYSRVGGVTLLLGPSTSQGTYGSLTTLAYTVVRCNQGSLPSAITYSVATASLQSVTITSFTVLDKLGSYSSNTVTALSPNNGTAPTYYAYVTEPISGLSSPMVSTVANLVLPPDYVGVPTQVDGLTATVSQPWGGTNTAGAVQVGPEINLTWLANAAPQGTAQPGLPALLDYQVGRSYGLPQGVSNLAGGALVTYTDDSLTNSPQSWGHPVTLTVQARNGKGYGLNSLTLTVNLLPPQAPNVTLAPLTGTATNTSVTLNWPVPVSPSPVTNEGYEVMRLKYAGNTPVFDQLVTGVAATSGTYSDFFLPGQGTQIGYAVGTSVSYGAATISTWDSTTATAVPQVILTVAAKPLAPSGLTATTGVDSATLTWQPATNASSYWVYRSTYTPDPAGLPNSALLQQNVPCCSYADLTAPGQVQSYYSVAGVNITSLGMITYTATTPLQGTPANLVAAPGWNYGAGAPLFNLTWQAPPSAADAATYNVFRNTVAAMPSPATALQTGVTTTGYTDLDPTLLPLTPYYYFVEGVDLSGPSNPTPSAEAYAYPPIPASGATGLTLTGQGAGLFAQWRALAPSTGVTGYFLEVSTTANALVYATTVAATQTTAYLPLSGTALHQTLKVQIQGQNSAGYGPTSVSSTGANNALNGNMPQGVSGTVGFYESLSWTGRVSLSFATPTSGTLYIYRDVAPMLVTESAGGPNTPFFRTEVDGVDSFVDTQVIVGVGYYYAFTSWNGPGLPGPGGESPPAFLGPLTPTVAAGPCAISGTAGNGKVDLFYSPPAYWGTNGPPASPNSTGFLIYRQGSPAAVAAPAAPNVAAMVVDAGFPVTQTAGSTLWTDTSVVNGYAYNYFIRAVDGLGWPSDQWAYPHLQAPYAADIAPMVPLAPQPAPQKITAVAGDNSVTLRWVTNQADADTGAFGGTGATYNVYRRPLTVTTESMLPWLQQVGPVAQDYPSGTTTDGLLVETLIDPDNSVDPPKDLAMYCYCISTVNSRGESAKSQEVCTTPYKPLAAPSWVVVSSTAAAGKNLWIGWSPVVQAPQDLTVSFPLVGYEVLRSSNGGNTFTTVLTGTATACTDTTTALGTSYLYRVAALDNQGNEGVSSPLISAVIPTGNDAIHVYRNAFDPVKGQSVPIQFSVQQNGHVWVKIFTLSGEYVATVFDENVSGASVAYPYLSTKFLWNGTNNQGQTVASGVYLIHAEGPGFRANARVAVIK